MKPRDLFTAWTALALITLLAVAAFGDQQRRIEIALALAADAPLQRTVIAHQRPNCEWLPTEKHLQPAVKKSLTTQAESQSTDPSPDVSVKSEPPSPAAGDEANAAERQQPQPNVAPQVTWITWQSAERSQLPTLVYFTGGPTCRECVRMEREVFPDRQVCETLKEFACVKLGTADAAKWSVTSFPYLIFVDADWSIRHRFEGGMGAESLTLAARKFYSDCLNSKEKENE